MVQADLTYMTLPFLLALILMEDWHFNNIHQIDGYSTTVLGSPKVVANTIVFNGVDDAIFVDVHPLAGAETFTWEVIFRPDPGGNPEQRFFHLQENGTDNRMLFETRIIGDQWCLDSFAVTGKESKALLNRDKLHPLGKWYNITAVYDGHTFSNYVDGELQGSGELHFAPQGAGRSSIGTRINKRDYFKGAVQTARFTRRALTPGEFLKAPK